MTKYFDAEGWRLAYDDVGEGEPIVLLHGFAADRRLNWKLPGWYDVLVNAGYRVLALDARGHGQSARPSDVEAYRPAGIAGDAIRLITSCSAVTYKFVETPAADENKDAVKGAKKPAVKK